MKVIKRDGSIVDFDRTKIEDAIQKAFVATKGSEFSVGLPNLLMSEVVNGLTIVTNTIMGEQALVSVSNEDDIGIETIQDVVESILMVNGHTDVAKAYILYREERAKERPLHPDPKALSDYIHYAKYAKHLSTEQRREVYLETSHRCRDMHLKKFSSYVDGEGITVRIDGSASHNEHKLYELITWAWDFVDNKIVLPSMRSMQFGGPAIEEQNTRMYNCSFTHIDRPRVFQEIFYLLLCGCGVGYSVQTQHVDKLPPILTRDIKKLRHYTIQDSIQGWADSIGVLVDSFFIGYTVEFNYSGIRPQGSILKISGGKAPGHFPLKRLHNILTTKLLTIHNRNLRPIEVHDILCHIADAVLSGGIRRSSLIALFSVDDEEMLYSKMPEEFEHFGINGQRALANNSAVLLRREDMLDFDNDIEESSAQEINEGEVKRLKEQFLKVMELNKNNPNGEPGFFFTNDLDHGCNPCGEIGLYPVLDKSFQLEDKTPLGTGLIEDKKSGVAFCNLTEINCAAIDQDTFFDACKAASIIGTLQAAYTDFPYLGKTTEEIVKRDALLGVSLTGMMDNPKLSLDGDWQQHGVKLIKETNREVAKLLNINPAKRLTTIKPSGTASLLLGGVASGIHPHHSRRYFRRVTANKNESVAQHIALFNPQMIEHKPNGDLSLIFPIEAPKEGLTLNDLSAKDFLDTIFKTYDNWIKPGSFSSELTHNISCTVCFKPEEYTQMVETIWENRHRIAAMSFIPRMSDKLLPYMPRESVVTDSDKVKWNQLVKDYTPIDYSQLKETTNNRSDLLLELACSADNQECGIISVDVGDTVEIVSCTETYLDIYNEVGKLVDSFGNKLVLVRRQ